MPDDKKRSGPKSMGVRVTPTGVEWAVVSGHQAAPHLVEQARIQPPAGLSDDGAALAWYRGQILDLIDRTGISAIAIRYAELGPTSKQVLPDRRRARIEGVLLEAAATRGITRYTGSLNSISARLKTAGAKKYIDSPSFRGIELPKKKEAKEAIIVAISGLNGDLS